ncbi:tail protein X [Amorphus sp. MBR-141]
MADLGYYVVVEDFERLDRIARALYGSEAGGVVEALLEATPGLADLGPSIPRGTFIRVPEPPALVPSTIVRPWE